MATPEGKLSSALRKKRRRKKSTASKKRRMKTKKKSNKKKSFDYVVAIPSYKRWEEITKKTLPTLKRGKVDKNKIHVFVANKTEEKLYREKLDPNTYGKIVVGKKGLVQQRRFISQYFPEGTMIVSLDDDIQKVIRLTKDEKLTELKDLDSFFKKAFRLLKEKNLYLWGVYPVNNALFMKNTMTTDLRFVIGVMHGYINRHDHKLYPSLKSVSKEDIEQTILFYLKDKGILRFNDITFRTVFNAPGGLGTNRYQMNKNAQEYLCKKYPKIAKPKFRPDGTPEVTLNRNPDI
tara:strand:+ start:215 stop:1087 length:873 start_codon:yes stop_codon:yes gene_type:complete